jgi:hypothetical protein
MSSSSWPRAGLLLTLALSLSCGGDKVGPEGTVSFIEIQPKTARLYTVGQQQIFTTTITTEAGTAGEGIPIGFKSRDETLIQINSTGIATALKKGGSTWIVATAGAKSDSAFIEVPATTCGSTPATTMTVGQVVTDIGAIGFCAAASPGEYAVIVHNTSLAASGNSSFEISGLGVAALSGSSNALRSRAVPNQREFGQAIRKWRRDVAAEMRRLREGSALLSSVGPEARTWYANRAKRATFAAADPVVGNVIRINVALSDGLGSCNDSTMVDARIAAVSNSAIVLADPRNPPTPEGFTDAEYNEFAQMFDSVIGPLDNANFGTPTDLDGNQRVLLVFTRSVNEKSPANASYYVGGLFGFRDLAPKTSCKASNQGELFYLPVPDSLKVVNGNDLFTKGFVLSITNGAIAHEYQHLINESRRTYINGGQAREVLWLNEGLSHIATELVFFHRAGRTPRSNFAAGEINTQAMFEQWYFYAFDGWYDYDSYGLEPTLTSPFEAGDELATRGATLSFLRYVADQKFSSDGTFWYDLVNSGDAGVTNIQKRLGNMTDAAFQAMFRDYVISIYADDFVSGVAAKYTQPSWNMRSMYPFVNQVFGVNWDFPVEGVPLEDAVTKAGTLQAGGFQVYRFSGLTGTDSYIRVTGPTGTALPAGITISVVRKQ